MIKYYCDICGKELHESKPYELSLKLCEFWTTGEFHICEHCVGYVEYKLEQLITLLKTGKLYKNIKNQNIYHYVGEAINCTNKDDGTKMVIYEKDNMVFVREYDEFQEKFERI